MGLAASRQRRDTPFPTIPGFNKNWLTLGEWWQRGTGRANP